MFACVVFVILGMVYTATFITFIIRRVLIMGIIVFVKLITIVSQFGFYITMPVRGAAPRSATTPTLTAMTTVAFLVTTITVVYFLAPNPLIALCIINITIAFPARIMFISAVFVLVGVRAI